MDSTNSLSQKIARNEAEFCGKVPLHQTNLVQPHGVLLVMTKDDFKILQCSENVSHFFGIEASAMVNTSLQQFITAQQFERIRNRMEKNLPGKIPVSFILNDHNFLALIETQADVFIAEIEKVDSAQDSFIDLYQDLKFSMTSIETADTTEDACRLIAKQLKEVSGFDKVMIYRFDKDWNGEVIAEEKEAEMDTYLGLKFPASDIPAQARELYKINPYRLIPNIDYSPVKLHPILNPVSHSFTNLSNCNLRSVAAVHIEYLRNMKVAASMSTRILKNGKLWGLIACHHRTPKYLSYQSCSVFELLSNIVSAKIAAAENADALAEKAEKHQLFSQIVEQVYRQRDLEEALQSQGEALQTLLSASGMALVSGKRITSVGQVPADAEIYDLVYWLQSKGVTKIWQEPSLPSAYEAAEAYSETASGLLALPIQPERGDFLLIFRPEEVKEVAWGGNPAEAIQFEADRKAYHPRSSFQQYRQKVSRTATEWKSAELDIAEALRAFVIEYTLNRS